MLKNKWGENGQGGTIYLNASKTEKCFPISNQRATNGERLQNEMRNLQTHFYYSVLLERNGKAKNKEVLECKMLGINSNL